MKHLVASLLNGAKYFLQPYYYKILKGKTAIILGAAFFKFNETK